MLSKREQKEMNRQKALGMEQKQTSAPFRFLVRPITTVNVSKGKLSNLFENEVFSALKDVTLASPISGILILPIIIDSSIAVPPRDRFVYQKRDNSVSVGINIEFSLWERSSVRERLDLLAENIRSSLSKIDSRYLLDEDRQKLLNIVDKMHANLAARLSN
jgi:hypothetical protein